MVDYSNILALYPDSLEGSGERLELRHKVIAKEDYNRLDEIVILVFFFSNFNLYSSYCS